jgi:hypothetical protein
MCLLFTPKSKPNGGKGGDFRAISVCRRARCAPWQLFCQAVS